MSLPAESFLDLESLSSDSSLQKDQNKTSLLNQVKIPQRAINQALFLNNNKQLHNHDFSRYMVLDFFTPIFMNAT